MVSIIIPCYNSALTIEKCLVSLLEQETEIPYEIIVVDSSVDQTPGIIREKFPKINLISLGQKTYPGAGRNIGARQAQGQILAFIDSDCIASKDWLSRGFESIQEGYKLVGGAIENANPQSWVSIADYILTFNESIPASQKRLTTAMPSCNLFCRKETFEELGGFENSILIGEDTLFCYKANQKFPLLFNPKCLVYHTNRTKVSKFLQHHYLFGRGSAWLRREIPLPGDIFVKVPIFSFCLPVVRYWRISNRLFHDKKNRVNFILSSPWIFMGISSWSCGFIIESFRSSRRYREMR